MANLDSRNKRASAVLYKLPFSRLFPNPDSSLADAGDRAQIALEYRGIADGGGGGGASTYMGPQTLQLSRAMRLGL